MFSAIAPPAPARGLLCDAPARAPSVHALLGPRPGDGHAEPSRRRVRYPRAVPGWTLYAPIVYALMGALSFAAYGLDKRRACRGGWRISERALHTIDLLGGVLGGLLAQRVWNHKRRKRTFVAITWTIALLHAAAWITLWRLHA